MKNTKKSIAVILTVIMVITSFSVCFSAFAVQSGYCPPPENDGAITVPEGITTSVDWDSVAQTLKSGVYNHYTYIDVSAYKIPYISDNQKYLANILYDSPEILRACNGFSYSYTSSYFTKIQPKYAYTAEEYQSMYAECLESVEKIIGDLKDNDAISDAEKVLLIHDRLAVINEYDYENLLSTGGVSSLMPYTDFNAYGALVAGSCVCQGYSHAMIWCLNELGIESYYNSSSTLNHGWVKVILDGESYHVDITADDPVWDGIGRVWHDSLLVSTDVFDTSASNHNNNGEIVYDFDREPSDTTYDNYYWKVSDTEFQLINDELYFIDNDNSTLCKKDVDGNIVVLKTISSKWKASSNTSYGTNAKYSKLTSHGTKLIYSVADAIKSYDVLSGEEATLYSVNLSENGYKCIYGFTKIDNTIKLLLSNTPNFNQNSKSGITDIECVEIKTDEIPATCTTDGVIEYYTCNFCNGLFSDEDMTMSISDEDCIIPADHYTITEVAAKKATCTENGNIAYFVCDDCGAYIINGDVVSEDDVVIPETGHTETVTKAAKAPTCTEDGNTVEISCSVCKTVLTSSENIKAKGHVEVVTKEAKNSDCTENGNTIEVSCSVCNEVITESQIIPATGHSAGSQVVENKIEATCNSAGGYDNVVYCKVCQSELSRTHVVVEKLAHKYQEKVKTPATCTESGIKTFTCSLCNDTYEKIIPATGHLNVTGTKGLSATCTEDGFTPGRYCSDCKTYISGHEVTPATGHSKVVDKAVAPTCSKSGLTEGSHCSTCGTVFESQKTVAKLNHTDSNNDGVCDNCGTTLTTEKPSACSCNCHKTGFMGFIYKIQRIFWKIFKTHQYCDCGAAHY